MMKIKYLIYFIVITQLPGLGCVEKYDPPVTRADKNFLVVDGYINNGTDSTIIKLSRTRNLGDTVSAVPELNARLVVEKDGAFYFQLQELGGGRYAHPGQLLDNSSKYRVRITSAQGKEYLSDEVSVVQTPPIDSISLIPRADGVTFAVNTHDPKNNTRYYRWEYEETWEYLSNYFSGLEYINGSIGNRPPEREIHVCYRAQKSTLIFLGTSASLANDIIYQSPLLTVPRNSIRISVKYSLLVKQYALTREAFNYWQNLKKTTEQLGSIFDVQPSQIGGNIHCLSDTTEPVLGFISASSMQEKRIFVVPADVDPWKYPPDICEMRIIPPDSMHIYFVDRGWIPINIVGFGDLQASPGICADCRLKGGTTVKPDFWP